MTFEDFERAKVIQDKVGIASGNLITLRRITDDAYGRPLTQHSYNIQINNSPSLTMVVDLDFMEMVLEYYVNQIETLNAEFAALGKENN
jgi:hypothetical protein